MTRFFRHPCISAGCMLKSRIHTTLNLRPLCTTLLLATQAAVPARAIQTNWKLTTNGNFSTAGNWDSGVPDSTKPAGFGLGLGTVSYTVTYNGAAIGNPP